MNGILHLVSTTPKTLHLVGRTEIEFPTITCMPLVLGRVFGGFLCGLLLTGPFLKATLLWWWCR
jgi:hypothetical protein